VLNGANIVRVHNVKATKETVTMIDAIMKAET
jgi:dihydropteroate synthase